LEIIYLILFLHAGGEGGEVFSMGQETGKTWQEVEVLAKN
jgi:hypothetical protein